MDKTSSAPVGNFKNRLGTRDKLSHSPQKSYKNFNSNGYSQQQELNFGSYSPDVHKPGASFYPTEPYAHPGGGQWQMQAPQVANMNCK